MPGIREKIEDNPVVWLLGTLLTGFLSGLGVYEGILKISGLETVSTSELAELKEAKAKLPELQQQVVNLQQSLASQPTGQLALPGYLDGKERDALFEKVRRAYDTGNSEAVYALFAQAVQIQGNKEAARDQMKTYLDAYGKIVRGAYAQGGCVNQGGYKVCQLQYVAEFEKVMRGTVSVSIVDQGNSYGIAGIAFFRQ